MTTQFVEPHPPEPRAETFAISIECPDCGARRAFQLGTGLSAILQRHHTSMGYQVSCEGCHRTFSFTIGWAVREPGWTSRTIGDRARSVVVEDLNGLRKP